jgi:integrase
VGLQEDAPADEDADAARREDGESVRPAERAALEEIAAEFDAIIGKLAAKVILSARLMEACGLRVGELTQLTYGDIDFAGRRLRVRERARRDARPDSGGCRGRTCCSTR